MLSCFGREDEISLSPVPARQDIPRASIRGAEYYIELFRRRLLQLYGAVPFNYRLEEEHDGLDTEFDFSEEIFEGRAKIELEDIYQRMERGVYHPILGKLHKEKVGLYFEVSIPTFTSPRAFARAVRRGQQAVGFLAREASDDECTVRCFNAVSDRKGPVAKSCGTHRRFLRSRTFFQELFNGKTSFISQDLPAEALVQDLITFQVLHSVFCGEGKVGADRNALSTSFQISARADFIDYLAGCSTTSDRPIVNTRDTDYANPQKFSCLHVINGEGNRSFWSIQLDVGLMAIFLAALEDGVRLPWHLESPVEAWRTISRDIMFREKIDYNRNGALGQKGTLELLEEILSILKHYIAWAHVPDWCHEILAKAKFIVEDLKKNGPGGEASRYLDWCIKRKFILHMMEKKHLNPCSESSWLDPRMREVDLAYHRLDNEKFWEAAGGVCDIEDFDEFFEPFGSPRSHDFWAAEEPDQTRSYLFWLLTTDPHLRVRTQIINWHEFYFKEDRTTRITLGDPRHFSKTHLTSLIGNATDFSARENRLRLVHILEQHEMNSAREVHEPPPKRATAPRGPRDPELQTQLHLFTRRVGPEISSER